MDRETPHLRTQTASGVQRLAASGDWTLQSADAIESEIAALVTNGHAVAGADAPQVTPLVLDISDVRRLDTTGAWLIVRTLRQAETQGRRIGLNGGSASQRGLIEEVHHHANGPGVVAPSRRRAVGALLADTGRSALAVSRFTGRLVAFLGAVVGSALTVTARPARFRLVAFVHHLEHVGLRAMAIVALICFLIGAVVLQQGAVQLSRFGAAPFSVDMLAILVLREVGVLLTAVTVAGRSGAAFTAEIGAMKMREEIDAMRTLGIDPVEALVLPRVLALIVAVPLLTFFGAMMCLAGGAFASVVVLGFGLPSYLERLHDVAAIEHFVAGMVKTPFIALVIGLVGCMEGLNVGGSAESLGRQVTSSVVKAIVLVIVVDALFAMFLSAVGV